MSAGAKFKLLSSLYDSPERAYHNLRHIEECLAAFDDVRHLAMNPTAVETAIFYHDAVYDTQPPFPGWNEDASVGIAVSHMLHHEAVSDLVCRVAGLILATKHDGRSSHVDDLLMADIDISIFGATPERVDEYEEGIWTEYSWIKDFIEARKLRAKILRGFLERPQGIFYTRHFSEKFGRAAEANLKRLVEKNS